ncbi:hypothetical protein GGR39_002934 [Novosphingobium fluoreni]|uniref:DUF2849 domain-containing protein n=1 Tax=Novosphingobium fluoreni TaxID=1391222 RepID=A0A7W6C0I1_9SPHN|nr:DUF2849 domain-containing protein [uncultured Novosphingobium sp.]KTR83862.1 hypothetical protein NS277_07965 [Novosphingobium barchaimii]MBB3941258.1 hypothetical protein [Novosphingobium fluoreni]
MKILTGNDLKSGAVIWWDGQGWSLHVNDAADVADQGANLIAREEAAQNVFAAYVIDGEKTADGVRPAHIKDRIRALGPTVRPDLTLKPADPSALNWVI